jgi:hypothetical protein
MKLHLFIDAEDAERCMESLNHQKLIAIDGADPLTGRVRSFRGVIVSVERAAAESPGQGWRVAIDIELAR